MTIQKFRKQKIQAIIIGIVGILMIITSLIMLVNTINSNNDTVKAKDTNKTIVSYDNLYLSKGIVISVNTDLNKVTVIDCDGEVYQFYGSEDWLVNDKCVLLMDNNSTDDIKDDIIIKTIYVEK